MTVDDWLAAIIIEQHFENANLVVILIVFLISLKLISSSYGRDFLRKYLQGGANKHFY